MNGSLTTDPQLRVTVAGRLGVSGTLILSHTVLLAAMNTVNALLVRATTSHTGGMALTLFTEMVQRVAEVSVSTKVAEFTFDTHRIGSPDGKVRTTGDTALPSRIEETFQVEADTKLNCTPTGAAMATAINVESGEMAIA